MRAHPASTIGLSSGSIEAIDDQAFVCRQHQLCSDSIGAVEGKGMSAGAKAWTRLIRPLYGVAHVMMWLLDVPSRNTSGVH